jgi:hypothetical protein
MPIIIWPVLWILAMLALIIATIVASTREKKTRVKAAPQSMQPVQMGQEAVAPLDGGDSFGATDGFEDDPFK